MALHLRMEIKKIQDIVKKLPLNENIGYFRELEGVKQQQKGLGLGVLKLIQDLVKVHKTFIKKTGNDIWEDMELDFLGPALAEAENEEFLEQELNSE